LTIRRRASEHPLHWRALASALLAISLGACAGGTADSEGGEEEDILAAIQIYLRDRGLNPDAMNMELAHLTLDGDQARASIRFTSADTTEGLEFEYELSRSEGSWQVVGSSGEDAHDGEGDLPEGHPPLPPPEPTTQSDETTS
jgi:hypothetical protein